MASSVSRTDSARARDAASPGCDQQPVLAVVNDGRDTRQVARNNGDTGAERLDGHEGHALGDRRQDQRLGTQVISGVRRGARARP